MYQSISSRAVWLAAKISIIGFAGLAPLMADQIGRNADAVEANISAAGQLPPAPEGVTDLKFSELYLTPVGPRGLELTEKAAALDGKRVRVLGYMVRQSSPAAGIIILAPFKLTTNESEYGLCDDLPPAVVFVDVPKYRDLAVPFTPGPLLLTGRLEFTRREAGAEGRIGHVHLMLDDEPAAVTR
jgi:hypothetical protein